MSDPIKLTYQGQTTVLQQGTIGVLNTPPVQFGNYIPAIVPYWPSTIPQPQYGPTLYPYNDTTQLHLPLLTLDIIKNNLERILPKVRMTKLQDLPGKKMGLDFGTELQSPGEAIMNLLEMIQKQIDSYGNDTQGEGTISGDKE